MTKEEFEQLITNNVHKNEILRLVEESICILPCKDDRSVSVRYDECAQLYKDSLEDYTHFRLNLSKQIDLLRYQSFVCKYQENVQATLSKLTQDVVMRVDAYAQNSKYNDSAFVNDVTTLLEKYECSKFYLDTKISELEDKKQLLELSDALQNDFSFYSFKLRGESKDKTFPFKSEKVKNMFAESFLPYFKSRFLEDESKGTSDIKKEIYSLKNILQSIKEDDLLQSPDSVIYQYHYLIASWLDFNEGDLQKRMYHVSKALHLTENSKKVTSDEFGIFDIEYLWLSKAMAEYYQEAGNIDKAIMQYERTLVRGEQILDKESNKNLRGVKSSCISTLGELYAKKGYKREAISCFEKAFEITRVDYEQGATETYFPLWRLSYYYGEEKDYPEFKLTMQQCRIHC